MHGQKNIKLLNCNQHTNFGNISFEFLEVFSLVCSFLMRNV